MTRPRAPLAAATAAVAIAACIGLGACGEDDETTTSPATTTDTTSTTTTGETTSTTTTTEGESGGTEAPLVPDEGHEGGGPDPGTEEFEAAQGNAGGQNGGGGSGGTSAGGGNTGSGPAGGPAADSGGQSPPESFEQYCEQNAEACE